MKAFGSSRNTWLMVGFLVIVFLGGIMIGRELGASYRTLGVESVRENSAEYEFVQPLLYVKVPEETSTSEYAHLKGAITSFASKAEGDKRAEKVSIYVRNLNTSQWVGANTDEKYAPSSMLKVATLIAVLKDVEQKPNLLQSKFTLLPPKKPIANTEGTYPPENPITPGNTYTIQEMMEHMIMDSDNLANRALSNFLGDEKLQEVYDDLQLPWVGAVSFPGYTTQEYSRLSRTLYNATYLSVHESERALDMLSKTNFTQGIVAGVPEGTKVSHKFGVYYSEERSGTKRELHDCGIVYYPEHPYFVCIMTRGNDYQVLEGVIKDASALVWDEIRRLH